MGVIKEMTEKLHKNDLCEDCEVELSKTDKFCPECGLMTENGRAMIALKSMGNKEEDPWGQIIDTRESLTLSHNNNVIAIYPSITTTKTRIWNK